VRFFSAGDSHGPGWLCPAEDTVFWAQGSPCPAQPLVPQLAGPFQPWRHFGPLSCVIQNCPMEAKVSLLYGIFCQCAVRALSASLPREESALAAFPPPCSQLAQRDGVPGGHQPTEPSSHVDP